MLTLKICSCGYVPGIIISDLRIIPMLNNDCHSGYTPQR